MASRDARAPASGRPLGLRAVILALAWLAWPVIAGGAAEIHVGVPRLPAALDPARATTAAELMALRLVFRGLVETGERGEIEPALASAWSVSRDGLTWTFRLRGDVALQDGSLVTVDDVVAALAGHLADDEPPAGAPAWQRLLRGPGRVVREVRASSGGGVPAVQVQLAQPYAPLLALLAHPALAVAVVRDGAPVGTGPYRVADREAGRLVLEAKPGASGEASRPARLVLHEVADDAAALAGLAPGAPLHAAFVVAPPAWSALGLQVVTGPAARLGLLALRADRGPTSKRAIRQAVALALDPAVLQPALGRWAVPHAALLPPGTWGLREAGPIPHDLARARRLLAQVGTPEPELTLLAHEAPSGPEMAAIAEAIRLSLAAAGFRVRARLERPDAAAPAARPLEADLVPIEAAAEINDPHFFLQPLLGADAGGGPGLAGNPASFRSPLLDGMLLRASQLGFRPERLRLYQRLQAFVAEEAPYVPLYARLQWLLARPDVRGARLDPEGFHRLERLRLEPAP